MSPELLKAIEAGAVIAYGATPGWAAWLAAERSATELVVVVAALAVLHVTGPTRVGRRHTGTHTEGGHSQYRGDRGLG